MNLFKPLFYGTLVNVRDKSQSIPFHLHIATTHFNIFRLQSGFSFHLDADVSDHQLGAVIMQEKNR
jgi:hypothetical protein